MTTAALPDLERLVLQMKDTLFARLMRRAQKAALAEWRDRTTAPGLAARFTDAGAKVYGYGERGRYYYGHKGMLPDYVKTGRLRDMLLKRKPRSSNAGGDDVRTRIAYGGGVLNFLTTIGPVISEKREVTRVAITIDAYTYKHHKTGALVSVAAYPSTRRRIRYAYQRASESYAAAFGRFDRDRPWIAKRVDELFLLMFRRLALKPDGTLKTSAVSPQDDALGGGNGG